MATSTIPAFRTALLARLAAATWPTATPQIARSHPYPERTEDELVYLAGTRDDDPLGSQFGGGQMPFAMGMAKRQERYVQTVMVSIVRNARDDVADMEARAFVLVGVIDANVLAWALAATPFDGVLTFCEVVSTRLDPPHLVASEGGQTPPSREVLITMDLSCAAEI